MTAFDQDKRYLEVERMKAQEERAYALKRDDESTTKRESDLRSLDRIQYLTYRLARTDVTYDHPSGTGAIDSAFAMIRQLFIDPQYEGVPHGDHQDEAECLRQAEGEAGQEDGRRHR